MTSTLEELADHADAAIAALTTRRTFEEARAALNEAGIVRARAALWNSIDRIEQAQLVVRSTAEVVARHKQAHAVAIADAEWELDSRFVVSGNKTYLVEACTAAFDDHTEANCGTCAGAGEVRRSMTADERTKWKQLEATKLPAVRAAAADLADAEALLAGARDELVVAEKFNQAARADLDAAIATVQTLAASIRKEQS